MVALGQAPSFSLLLIIFPCFVVDLIRPFFPSHYLVRVIIKQKKRKYKNVLAHEPPLFPPFNNLGFHIFL
jgi:hypothetical protein